MALAQAWALAPLAHLSPLAPLAPLAQLFPPEYLKQVLGPLRPYVLHLKEAHLLVLAVVLAAVLAVPLP